MGESWGRGSWGEEKDSALGLDLLAHTPSPSLWISKGCGETLTGFAERGPMNVTLTLFGRGPPFVFYSHLQTKNDDALSHHQ